MNGRERIRLDVRGRVQGVGFRPFACRLARQMGLGGWVRNTRAGATVEVEGAADAVAAYAARLGAELPAPGSVWSATRRSIAPVGEGDMRIGASDAAVAAGRSSAALVLPDVALCEDCRGELFDPSARRHRYPFITCARCGPRYSIAQALPFDRANTTMARFPVCEACRAEYEDPLDRRFHAQTIACSICGPRLASWNRAGAEVAAGEAAIGETARALASGEIVAVKGLGGFHLLVDASDEAAVRRLRARKHRPAKPLAVMFPSLTSLRAVCEATEAEEALLRGSASPVVLLRRKPDVSLAASVAPGTPLFGAMVPYTPLHALLLDALDRPLVATSGNAPGEPICTDEREALARLAGIADRFLVHDRPIARPLDDSVARVMGGGTTVLRLARGYAPLVIGLPGEQQASVLAAGGHLKCALAFAAGGDVVLGPHIGDLESSATVSAHARGIADVEQLFGIVPARVAHDAHPDYRSTAAARRAGPPCVAVQHHLAHVLACAAEHGLDEPVLGVAWDGTGLGEDGTVWGGEFLVVERGRATRVAHLRPFRLPGGDAAAREPRRSALGALAEALGDALFERRDLAPTRAFTAAELNVLRAALARGVCAPLTSSAGRLFDTVASLTGLAQRITFEGEAAMALEFAAERCPLPQPPYAVGLAADGEVDWRPALRAAAAEAAGGASADVVAARFHETMADAIVRVAQRHRPLPVLLTGGCFQNRLLLERCIGRLEALGTRVYWPQRVPPNDGGLALGQAVAAMLLPESVPPCA